MFEATNIFVIRMRGCVRSVVILATFGCSEPSPITVPIQPDRSPRAVNQNELFGVRDPDAPNSLLRDWLSDLENEGSEARRVELDHMKAVDLRDPHYREFDRARLRDMGVDWMRLSQDDLDREDGLSWLSELHSIKGISFAGLRMTNFKPARLEGLVNLRWLNFKDASLTAAMFKGVPSLHQLETLHLGGQLLNDDFIVNMSRFPDLKTLTVEESGITDQAVVILLQEVPAIECLSLYRTEISAASLPTLAEFSDLDYVALGVTDLAKRCEHSEIRETLKNAHVDLGD